MAATERRTKSALAKELGVSRSSLYYRPKKPDKDEALRREIERVLLKNPGYGSPRVAIALKIIPVSGKFGKDGVSFEIKGDKKPRALSTAKLSADGMTLTGTTTEEVPVTGGTAKVTFAWEAKRLFREQ